MDIRDAVEADADAMAALADQPEDVMRNLVHDRTVRVAVTDSLEEPSSESGDDSASDEDAEPGAEAEDLRGVVSFDAREDVVHITQLAGGAEIIGDLLEEPLRFARREGMAVEALIEADAVDRRDAVERAGFTEAGTGPMFDGERTVRYRADP